MKNPSFSRVVYEAESLQNAFESSLAARLWWRTILWLHGKPTAPQLSDETRRQIVADGFRFYAGLYRFLAVLFWIVSALVWFGGVFDSAREAFYWTGASVFAGAFLWLASGVGFAGAKAMREGKPAARLLLCAFMVAVIAWLSALLAVTSVVAQVETAGNPLLNLLSAGALWCFGVGSYAIEVLYLVAETRLTRESTCSV